MGRRDVTERTQSGSTLGKGKHSEGNGGSLNPLSQRKKKEREKEREPNQISPLSSELTFSSTLLVRAVMS